MPTLCCDDCKEPESDDLTIYVLCSNCIAGGGKGLPTLDSLKTVLESVSTSLEIGDACSLEDARDQIREALESFKAQEPKILGSRRRVSS